MDLGLGTVRGVVEQRPVSVVGLALLLEVGDDRQHRRLLERLPALERPRRDSAAPRVVLGDHEPNDRDVDLERFAETVDLTDQHVVGAPAAGLGLDRHQHARVRAALLVALAAVEQRRVDRETEAGWAVDDDHVEVILERLQGVLERALAGDGLAEFEVKQEGVHRCRQHVQRAAEPGVLERHEKVLDVARGSAHHVQQQRVAVAVKGLQTELFGQVALWIVVDEEHALAVLSERLCQTGGGHGLANPAFLVADHQAQQQARDLASGRRVRVKPHLDCLAEPLDVGDRAAFADITEALPGVERQRCAVGLRIRGVDGGVGAAAENPPIERGRGRVLHVDGELGSTEFQLTPQDKWELGRYLPLAVGVVRLCHGVTLVTPEAWCHLFRQSVTRSRAVPELTKLTAHACLEWRRFRKEAVARCAPRQTRRPYGDRRDAPSLERGCQGLARGGFGVGRMRCAGENCW